MRKKHFTLVEIMIVVAIIGLLAAIAIPSFLRARQTSQQNACINNMRQIHSAVQQFLLEEGEAEIDAEADDWMRYIDGDTEPECPVGGTYTIDADGVECDEHDLNHRGEDIS